MILGQYNIKFQDPKTPEVFQFEKYGNVPTSKYTGRPNITIPLHTINCGDINIPLNIQYTSNGIRVDEEASQVGLGWYFGTGMISQIKNGKDDLSCTVELPDFLWSPYGSQEITTPNPFWYYELSPNLRSADNPLRVTLSPTTPSNILNQYFAAKVSSDGALSQSNNNTLYLLRNNQLKDYDVILNDQRVYSDASLDIFQANFFGHELYFYINPISGKINVMNNEKYKIELFRKSASNPNNRWKITAPDGISYYFNEQKITETKAEGSYYTYDDDIDTNDGTGYKTSISSELLSGSSLTTYSTWKINQIIDVKGNVVNFYYENLSTAEINAGMNGVLDLTNATKDYHYFTGIITNNVLVKFDPDNRDVRFPINNGVAMSRRNLHGNYLIQERSILKEISYDNTRILFNNSDRIDLPGDKKLDNINISYTAINNNTNIIDFPVKQINFNYDYFTNPSLTDDTQKRLKLNSIYIGEKPYIFTYNQIILPSKSSNSVDFWGFYNGMPNTTYLNNPFRLLKNSIGNFSGWTNSFLPLIEGKANKSAHPDYCKAGILEKIEYPTGGSTEFKYELNEFNNYFFPNYDNKIGVSLSTPYAYLVDYPQESSKGFGLRVSQTIDYDNKGNSYKKIYSYSGGKHIPAYLVESSEKPLRSARFNYNWDGSINSTVAELRVGSYVSINSNSNYQSSFLGNGNFVGYDKVTVEEESLNPEHNGKTVSYYTNVPDVGSREIYGSDNSNSTGYPASNYDLFGYSIRSTDVDNGLLIKEEIFDKYSNRKQTSEYAYESIVSPSSDIKYNVSAVKIPGNRAFIKPNPTPDGGSSSILSEFGDYLFFYYPLKLTNTKQIDKKITDFIYNYSSVLIDSIENRTHYFYNNPVHQQLTSKNTSDSKKWIQETFYKYPSDLIGVEQTPYMQQLVDANRIEEPVVTITTNGSTKLTENHIKYGNSQETGNLLLPTEIHTLKGNAYISITAIEDRKIQYTLYDTRGNIQEYKLENGTPISIIWGYNKTQPIAKIENATYASIPATTITGLQTKSDTDIDPASETTLRNSLNALRTALPIAMVTTYTYDPLIGVTSVTDPKGYTMYYSYDTYRRLQNVKDKNGNILSENEYHYKN